MKAKTLPRSVPGMGIICNLAKEMWNKDTTVEGKWSALRSSLTEAAESVLGKMTGYQLDWYKDSAESLESLIE